MAKYLIPQFFFPSSKICSYMSEVLNGILNGKWGTCVTSERVSLLHFLEKLLPKKKPLITHFQLLSQMAKTIINSCVKLECVQTIR